MRHRGIVLDDPLQLKPVYKYVTRRGKWGFALTSKEEWFEISTPCDINGFLKCLSTLGKKKSLLNVLDITLSILSPLFFLYLLYKGKSKQQRSPCLNYLKISKWPKSMRFYWQKIQCAFMELMVVSKITTQYVNTNDLTRIWETPNKTKCFKIYILKSCLTFLYTNRSEFWPCGRVYLIRIAVSLLIT